MYKTSYLAIIATSLTVAACGLGGQGTSEESNPGDFEKVRGYYSFLLKTAIGECVDKDNNPIEVMWESDSYFYTVAQNKDYIVLVDTAFISGRDVAVLSSEDFSGLLNSDKKFVLKRTSSVLYEKSTLRNDWIETLEGSFTDNGWEGELKTTVDVYRLVTKSDASTNWDYRETCVGKQNFAGERTTKD